VKEEKKKDDGEINKELEELFDMEYGFTSIIEAMMDCGKPVVGHNMVYDILYIYNQFIGELPDTFRDFIIQVSLNDIIS
jgi:poly(A)-specific ribonuclease